MSVRHLALAIALSAFALPAAYAAGDSDAPPAAPATAAMPADCARMARHDHGAEKDTPTPMMAGCPMAGESAGATVAPVKKAKARTGHDHARTHKLM